MLRILLPIIVAAVVFMICMFFIQLIFRNERKDERLKQIMESKDQAESNEYLMESLRSEKAPSALAVTISKIFTIFGVDIEKFHTNNQLRFYQAGIQSPDAHIYYFLFSRVVSVILVLLAIVVVMNKNAGLVDYILGLNLAGIGIFGADMVIKHMQEKRKRTLQHSFPDALDLLLACVESGLALDGALLRVCKELGRAHPEMTQELNRLRVELSLLNDRTQALNNFAERNGMTSFRALVTALLQSERFGTSLTDTLRVMSEDFRTQRLMKAEEKAGRLPALITVPLIIFLLPALFLIILGPAVLTAFATLK